MTETAAGSLSIRACRLEDREGVLELWRQADAMPGVTDTPDWEAVGYRVNLRTVRRVRNP